MLTLLRPHKDVSGKTGPEGIVLMLDQAHLGKRPFLSVLVTHEYAHYALGSMRGFSRHVPWWFQEGFAQYVSQNLTPNRLSEIKTLLDADRLIPLSALERGMGHINERDILNMAYLESHTAVAYMVKKYHFEGFRKFIAHLREGKRMRSVFKSLGSSYEDFERGWVNWLKECLRMGSVRMTREVKIKEE